MMRDAARVPGMLVAVCLASVAPDAAGAQRAGAEPYTRVRGTVFDSVGRSSLAGALVQFVGTAARTRGLTFAARTDTDGVYEVDSLPSGAYLAGFFHRAADSLGIEATPRRVEVRGGEQEVAFATPSPASLMRALCGEDAGALLLGHVRDAVTESAVSGASAWVEWIETVVDRAGVRSRERADTARTRESGFFSVCRLPGDVSLLARVARGADSTGYVEVEVPEGGVRHLTFYLGAARRVHLPAAASGDSSVEPALTMLRGRARLSGTVRDNANAGVPGARLVLLGAGVEGSANSAGHFLLDSLPAGSFTLEARAIGYAPARRTVQLLDERPLAVTMSLGPRIFTLPTEIVRGELVYSRSLEGFERRRRTQFNGRFLSPREIQARPRSRLSTLLQGLQGVEVTNRAGFSLVVMKVFPPIPGIEFCAPTLWVNGILDQVGDFDRHWSDEIAALEVYPRASGRPMEFTDRSECGAIAIWLRPRTSDVRPPDPP